MKKSLILVLVMVAIVFPVTAKTNLVNFGYNVHGKFWDYDDLNLRSVGVNFITLKSDKAGFYTQINPYYSMSFKDSGVVYKFSDLDYLGVGGNFIFGYGGDLNFGNMGLILGGGLFVDLNYISNSIDYAFTISTGLGFGANFYFQPGTGNMVINAGLALSWRPWAYEINEYDAFDYTNYKMTNTNFNIGIGWRTSGIGSGRSSSTSSDGGGGDDDW